MPEASSTLSREEILRLKEQRNELQAAILKREAEELAAAKAAHPVIESFPEWAGRHGGVFEPHDPTQRVGIHIHNPEVLKDFPEGNGRILWPDGATCSNDNGDIRWEPPTNPIVLLRFKRAYAGEQLGRMRTKVQAVGQQAVAYPSPGSNQLLRDLMELLEKHRLLYRCLDEQYQKLLSETPAAKARANWADLDVKFRQEQERLRDEAKHICSAIH